MKSRIRLMLRAGVFAVLAAVTAGCSGGGATTVAAGVVQGASTSTISDAAGDTVSNGTTTKLAVPQADLMATSATYGAGAITLTARVRQPSDPVATGWGDSTFLTWQLDTNGDGKPDYDIQYYVDSGELVGDVTRTGTPDSAAPLCDASSATYAAATGYAVVVDPKCVGNPKAFSYRVRTYYDTRPGEDKAPVATDVVPDKHFSPQIKAPR
jgi:hypothetical protein